MLAAVHHADLSLVFLLIAVCIVLAGAYVAYTGRVAAGLVVAIIGVIFAIVFVA